MTNKRNAILRTMVGVVLLFAVVITVFQVSGRIQRFGILERNLDNAKAVTLALHEYASDYEGHFPGSLQALMPKYCTSENVLLETVSDGHTKVRWRYEPGHKSDEKPIAIVIASSPNSTGERVVGYTDGWVKVLSASDDTSR